MRRVRGEAGVSLRDLEARGAWRRSTISQVETGKARPSRELVEWCDAELGSDGLLLSIYAEALAHQLRTHGSETCDVCLDDVRVVDVDPPAGLLVPPGARLPARVTLRNAGRQSWRGRELRRMGAYAGLRLIGSTPETPVPDADPGEIVDVAIDLHAPEVPGSAIAYWKLATGPGDNAHECAQSSPPIAVLLLVG
jgi:transcriptional regulator with XRE-family HTH domain